MVKVDRKTLQIVVSKEAAEYLAAQAKQLDLTVSELVRRVLEDADPDMPKFETRRN
jgi:hypothetical protein